MKTLTLLMLCALSALAQNPPTVYARAYYTKWKPGMREEGQRFIRDVAMKVPENMKAHDANFAGQVTMSRVHPSLAETGIDRLRLVITKTPPDLGAGATPSQWLEGTGLTPAQYSAKLGSLMDAVKTQIGRSVYRHGSLHQEDFVSIRLVDAPPGKSTEYLKYVHDYEAAMRGEIVKQGAKKGLEEWQVIMSHDGAAGHFVSLSVSPDSGSVFQNFPDRQELFLKVHPGKSYYGYREMAEAVAKMVGAMVFRVDSAIWK